MKTILIPSDFSDNASRAIQYAVAMFGSNDTHFIITHAIAALDYPPEVMDGISANLRSEINNALINQLESALGAEELAALHYEIAVDLGSPKQAIKALALQTDADLIVMGTKGIGKKERLSMGTTAVETIQLGDWPVIVVPEVAFAKQPSNIMFASDTKTIANPAILGPLKSLASRFDAHVSVLNIITDEEKHAEEISAIRRDLNVRFGEVSHSYSFRKYENVIDGIMLSIQEGRVDLLAMIAKHHGDMESLLESSNTAAMAIYSDVPLLVLPDKSLETVSEISAKEFGLEQ